MSAAGGGLRRPHQGWRHDPHAPEKNMGDSGILTKKKTKFNKKPKPEHTWANGKVFYREALEDIEESAKCAGSNEFPANSTVGTKHRAAAEDEIHNEMAAKMEESFNPLAMAAKISKATYEDQAHTISTLTATNTESELTVTIKKLTEWTRRQRPAQVRQ